MVKTKQQRMTLAAFVNKNEADLKQELEAYEKAEKQKAEKEKTERLEASEGELAKEAEFADPAVSFLNALINKNGLAQAIKKIPQGPPPSPERSDNRSGTGTAVGRSLVDSIRYATMCARQDKRTTKFAVDVSISGLQVLQDYSEEAVNKYLETLATKLEEKKKAKKKNPAKPETKKTFGLTWRRLVTEPEDKDDEDEEGKSERFSREFEEGCTYEALDVFFEKLSEQNTKALERELEIKRTPLAPDQFKGEVMEPQLAYVKTEPPQRQLDSFFTLDNQQSYAIVIAGESGAGKSVFACQKALEENFSVLYLCLEGEDFGEDDRTKPLNLKGEFVKLNDLFELAIKEASGEADKNKLHALKRRLNTSRDGWAKSVLRYAINKNDNRSCMKSWMEGGGWRPENRPENVAIVVDEATDIDLIEGLVASVREITTEYSHLAQKNVLLVIAGVGSDLIKEEGRIGTNPSHSKLVVVKGPDIAALRSKVSTEVAAALEKGTFARTLRTNSRMLFRSVLPILEADKHRVDPKFEEDEARSRLEDRLVEIGSFGPIMDHGCRFYVRANSVGALSRIRLFELLSQAFCYHLVTAMEGVTANGNMKANLDRELNRVRKFKSYVELNDPQAKDSIFTKGLSSRSGTSSALKFLACFGLTCELRPSFGNDFEEMTALHYMRYQQVQGYKTRRVKLKHAWPPQSNKNDAKIEEGATQELDSVLEEQKETELVQESAIMELATMLSGSVPPPKRRKTFNNDIGGGHLYCDVFDQGTPTAQGGDVLALLVDTKKQEASLDCTQCKHYQKKEKNEEIRKWWNSLGVLLHENGSSDFEPATGSAGYSYKGLQKFAELLSKRLSGGVVNIKVDIGTRILAASFHSPKRQDCKLPMPGVSNQHRFRVWFREMMEPTISAIQPIWAPLEYSDEE